jgi:hypothetical protein
MIFAENSVYINDWKTVLFKFALILIIFNLAFTCRRVLFCWLTVAILAMQEVEIRRIIVLSQSWQKVSKTPSQSMSQMWWYNPAISAMREAVGRRITV